MRKSAIALWIGLGSALFLGNGAWGQEAPGNTSGTVVETMDTAGYTYVLIDDGEKQTWFAAPDFAVAVGDKVVAPAGAPMRDHYSKTLDRTFELIYFVGGVHREGSPDDSSKSPFRHSGASGAGSDGGLDLSGIEKADGGKTVAEIFDEGRDLAGQVVVVRGRVTKFSPRILGTNFLHLQDGSSSKDDRNDLTVTTKSDVKVGSLVVVRGLVSTDRDFGHGYTYDLIIEDASVTEE